tara:strand:+ start:548 stop:1978 length:1431 start_codon:yes stop_codon:yes gene_type:complete
MKRFLLLLLLIPLVSATEYTDTIDHYFLESDTYIWKPQHEGEIKSIKVEGEIEGTGRVRVYLVSGGTQIVVYARSQEDEEFVINEYVQLEEGTDIGLILNYGTGDWDTDNDGIEQVGKGIDYELEPIFFDVIDEENLCTVWEVYSVENEKFTTQCYGASGCCSFLGYTPRLADWDADFVIAKDSDGATKKNVILARVVFFNTTKVGYSNYDALGAYFVESDVNSVAENVSRIYNASQNILRVQVDDGTYFNLHSIEYVIEENVTEEVVENVTEPDFLVPPDQPPKPEEPLIIETDDVWTGHFPRLERVTYQINNSLPVKNVVVRVPKAEKDATIQLSQQERSGTLTTIQLEAPEEATTTLDLQFSLEDLDGDLGVKSGEENLTIIFLRSDLTNAYYRMDVQGTKTLDFFLIIQEPVSLISFKPFWWLMGTLIIAIALLLVYGVRKFFYREVDIQLKQWKFKKDVRYIHNVMKKYGR